jgi:histone-lysine N-methyltransferase SETMAR
MQMRPRLAHKNVLLLHDNAPSHTAAATVEFINSYKRQLLSHPPYSLDIAPCDFFLLPELKKMLAGKIYKTRVASISAVTQYLKHRSTSWFAAGIQRLQRRWQTSRKIFF